MRDRGVRGANDARSEHSGSIRNGCGRTLLGHGMTADVPTCRCSLDDGAREELQHDGQSSHASDQPRFVLVFCFVLLWLFFFFI